MSPAGVPERPAWLRPLAVAFVTTALVTALSYGVPAAHAASAVGIAFLLVTYRLASGHTSLEWDSAGSAASHSPERAGA